jgi:hypothetical protein
VLNGFAKESTHSIICLRHRFSNISTRALRDVCSGSGVVSPRQAWSQSGPPNTLHNFQHPPFPHIPSAPVGDPLRSGRAPSSALVGVPLRCWSSSIPPLPSSPLPSSACRTEDQFSAERKDGNRFFTFSEVVAVYELSSSSETLAPSSLCSKSSRSGLAAPQLLPPARINQVKPLYLVRL